MVMRDIPRTLHCGERDNRGLGGRPEGGMLRFLVNQFLLHCMYMVPDENYLQHTCRQALADLPVDFVYLFGSQATGRAHDESDIDVAVAFSRQPTDNEYALVLSALCKTFGVSYRQLDMGDFDRLPLPVRFRVIRDGKLIYLHNVLRHRDAVLRTTAFYHDEQPMIEQLNRVYFARKET